MYIYWLLPNNYFFSSFCFHYTVIVWSCGIIHVSHTSKGKSYACWRAALYVHWITCKWHWFPHPSTCPMNNGQIYAFLCFIEVCYLSGPIRQQFIPEPMHWSWTIGWKHCWNKSTRINNITNTTKHNEPGQHNNVQLFRANASTLTTRDKHIV